MGQLIDLREYFEALQQLNRENELSASDSDRFAVPPEPKSPDFPKS